VGFIQKYSLKSSLKGSTRLPFHLPYWKWIRLGVLLALDLFIICVSYWISFALRLDTFALGPYQWVFLVTLPVLIIGQIGSFFALGVYRQVWRYANFNSAVMIAKSVLLGLLFYLVVVHYGWKNPMLPRSVPIIFFFIATILMIGTKFFWRYWVTFTAKHYGGEKIRCLVYGAGSAGEFPYEVIGFIDDDRNKTNRIIHGSKILGGGKNLKEIAAKNRVNSIVIAIHSVSGKTIRNIVNMCHQAGITPLIMPEITSSLGTDIVQPRGIDVADLLKRSPKDVDRESIRRIFSGATVMITGAGGSIGSEIVRQVSASGAKRLILVDASEHNLYQIDTELKDNAQLDRNLKVSCCLGSVADYRFISAVMEKYRTEIILHAAAYKHVPMVECNPLEGIINNVLGTKILCELAMKVGVKNFLLVSSDKAVRPTNIMGGTKRCCELIIQASNKIAAGKCKFGAVRFGNVLGSSGSVIPRFLSQIKSGGPLTVTHPEVTRYFMLTEEAVGLVLQSVAHSKGGEIFVLDMGEPVNIAEMAQQLIRLAGKEPGRDIEIEYTGLRPGEKLYEELVLEGTEKTTVHENVFISTQEFPDPASTMKEILTLLEFSMRGDTEKSIQKLKQLSFAIDESLVDRGLHPQRFVQGELH
jgi:FlaA1/EpsC-like NDP-sugar epimerase